MNFGFNEEQELLRAEVRKFLDQNASLERVREIVEGGDATDPALWGRMAELGWVGLNMPESHAAVRLGHVKPHPSNPQQPQTPTAATEPD